MEFTAYGIGSTVFLILYTFLFVWLIFGYVTRRFRLKSRWSLLLFHVTIRLAAQAVAIAFSFKGVEAVDLLIAVLVLSAEGYFTLMMCALRVLISWQRRYRPDRHSPLAGSKNAPEMSTARRVIEALTLVGLARTPINAFHWLLIVGNVMIIVGGTMLAGDSTSTAEAWALNSNNTITTSKALRGTGQGIFLLLTIITYACIAHSTRRASGAHASADERRQRPILLIMLVTAPFMFCRGIFGLLQAVVDKLNYYNPEAYDATGFTPEFAIKEICLATLCEWATCALLLATSLFGLDSRKRAAEYDPEGKTEVDSTHAGSHEHVHEPEAKEVRSRIAK